MHTLFIVALVASVISLIGLMAQLYQAQMKQQPLTSFWRWSLTSAAGQFFFFGGHFLRGVVPEAVATTVALVGCVLCIVGGVGLLSSLRNARTAPPTRERIGNR